MDDWDDLGPLCDGCANEAPAGVMGECPWCHRSLCAMCFMPGDGACEDCSEELSADPWTSATQEDVDAFTEAFREEDEADDG